MCVVAALVSSPPCKKKGLRASSSPPLSLSLCAASLLSRGWTKEDGWRRQGRNRVEWPRRRRRKGEEEK